MKKLVPIYAILTLFAVLAGVSCNETTNEEEEPVVTPTSTLVKKFSLLKDDSVLVDLDSVHFSIDTDRRVIYNADSLPKGTKISKLLANIELDSYATAEISIAGAEVMPDTTFTYSDADEDTIDFTGIVVLKVKAADGKSENQYRVNVNVHKVEADSLYWSEMARRDLPGRSNTIDEQKTAICGDKIYCLIKELGGYTIASTSDLSAFNWEKETVKFDFEPKVESFNATDKALVVIGVKDNKYLLYSSLDGGKTWTTDGDEVTSIIGGYGDYTLFVSYRNFKYVGVKKIVGANSPETVYELDEDFPIIDQSQCITISNKWSDNKQVIFIGGSKQGGDLIGDAWGFDGNRFGKVSRSGIPPVAQPVLVKYTNAIGENYYSKKNYPVLLAIGGINNQDKATNKVYISYDNGVTWKIGDDYLQLPNYIKPFFNAQGFTVEEKMGKRAKSGWSTMQPKKLPHWYQVMNTYTRATQDPTSWECPYIYIFGGQTENFGTYNNVWKGALNRLTFKPIV